MTPKPSASPEFERYWPDGRFHIMNTRKYGIRRYCYRAVCCLSGDGGFNLTCTLSVTNEEPLGQFKTFFGIGTDKALVLQTAYDWIEKALLEIDAVAA